MQTQFLTVEEVSKVLGFSPAYVRKLCHYRKLPHFKPLGGKLLFDAAEIEDIVRKHRVLTADELSEKAAALLNERGAK